MIFASCLYQSKKVSEEDLRKEFEMYGSIERIRIVKDKKGKSRSYAFIVFDRERDMKGESRPPRGRALRALLVQWSAKANHVSNVISFLAAYKDAEGIPIHHKKILVDVERGRTVKGWKPHKLGGGLGGRPKPVDPVAVAPPMAPVFTGGGFRGGMRGGPGGGGGFRGVSRSGQIETIRRHCWRDGLADIMSQFAGPRGFPRWISTRRIWWG